MRQEVLEEKILDKRDDLLRLLLLDVLGKEAAEDQSRALLKLMQQHLKRLEQKQDQPEKVASVNQLESSSCPEAMDIDESSSKPVGDSATGTDDDTSTQLQHYFSLLTRLQPSTAAHPEA